VTNRRCLVWVGAEQKPLRSLFGSQDCFMRRFGLRPGMVSSPEEAMWLADDGQARVIL